MIVYNTTFHVANEIADDALFYLKKQYIPQAAISGFLQRPCLRKVLHTATDEGISFAVQFHVKNMETLNHWIQTEGCRLQQALVDRFGDKVVGFSTLLEEINWES